LRAARFVSSTIRDDDVILTFGSSPLVRKALLCAAKTKRFRLVVADTRPLCEGLRTLAAVSNVVHCVYSPLSGAAAAMSDVTRVLLGASCFMSNGAMLAPAGTAMVAALARSKQVPVIVASESYKFSEKVQLDSIVFNELGNTREIAVMSVPQDGSGSTAPVPVPQLQSNFMGMCVDSVDKSAPATPVASAAAAGPANTLSNEQADAESGAGLVSVPVSVADFNGQPSKTDSALPFAVVNLRYDLTPIANISVVATESGLIPPTSIPVLIRELQADFGEK
jgi:translation initiation factor 2B subunit (eIF-2B alpha/beta/delta family)